MFDGIYTRKLMVLWFNSTCCDVWRDLQKEVDGTVIELHMLWCLKRSTQGCWWYYDWTPYTRKLMVLWLNSTCCDVWRDLHKEVDGTVIELHMLWCLKRSTQGRWWYCDWTPHAVMFEEIYTRKLMVLWLNSTCCDVWRDLHKEVGVTVIELHMLWCLKRSTQGSWWYCDWTPVHMLWCLKIYTRKLMVLWLNSTCCDVWRDLHKEVDGTVIQLHMLWCLTRSTQGSWWYCDWTPHAVMFEEIYTRKLVVLWFNSTCCDVWRSTQGSWWYCDWTPHAVMFEEIYTRKLMVLWFNSTCCYVWRDLHKEVDGTVIQLHMLWYLTGSTQGSWWYCDSTPHAVTFEEIYRRKLMVLWLNSTCCDVWRDLHKDVDGTMIELPTQGSWWYCDWTPHAVMFEEIYTRKLMVLWFNSTCCDVWRDLHKEVDGTVIELHMLWCLKRSTQGSWWYCDLTPHPPHAVMFEEIYTRKLMVLWLNSTCCDVWRDLHKEVGVTVIELHMLWCLKIYTRKLMVLWFNSTCCDVWRSTQGSWWYCDWTPHAVMFEEIYTKKLMVLWFNSTCCDVWWDLHKEVGGTVIELHMLWCLKIYTRKLMVLWLNSTCCDVWRDLHKEVDGTVIQLHMLWCLTRSTQGSWWYCDSTPHAVMFEEIYTRKLMVLWLNSTCCDVWRDLHKEVDGTVIELHMLWCLKRSTQGSWWYCDSNPHAVMFEEIYTRKLMVLWLNSLHKEVDGTVIELHMLDVWQFVTSYM